MIESSYQTPSTTDNPAFIPSLQFCPALNAVLRDNPRLTVMLRQLHFRLGLSGGVDFGGHHWIYESRMGWASILGFRSVHVVKRVVAKGRDLGLFITHQNADNRMHYRIDYARSARTVRGSVH